LLFSGSVGKTRRAVVLFMLAVGCGPQPYAPPPTRGADNSSGSPEGEGAPPATDDAGDPTLPVMTGSPEDPDGGAIPAADLAQPPAAPDFAPPPPVPGSTMPGTCTSGNGVYCGGNGITGDPRALYDCTNGTLTVLAICQTMCVRAPAGTPDYCQ
jgi:hypothetical protein